jgi:uncharacterized Zn finger protein (UPF0148 family)
MQCKCSYFRWVNGELVCSVCGRPARRSPGGTEGGPAHASTIEDKIAPISRDENKKKKKREVK